MPKPMKYTSPWEHNGLSSRLEIECHIKIECHVISLLFHHNCRLTDPGYLPLRRHFSTLPQTSSSGSNFSNRHSLPEVHLPVYYEGCKMCDECSV